MYWTHQEHSLNELVRDGVNGLVFQNAGQLATQLEVRISYSFLPSPLNFAAFTP